MISVLRLKKKNRIDMYKIKIKDANITTDKYIFRTSSMAGESIGAIFDNEKEVAYYCFSKNFYKLGILSSVCTYNDLFNPD
jgi:hypothetical protein